MLTTFDPKTLASRWNTSPESVITLIRAKKLRAFTLSPSTCKRPRWKIPADAVAEFEAGSVAKPTPTPPRRKKAEGVVQFY